MEEEVEEKSIARRGVGGRLVEGRAAGRRTKTCSFLKNKERSEEE